MVVNFNPVERFILGAILGLLAGFVSAGVFSFDRDLAELVGIVTAIFGTIGVVPPTSGTVPAFLHNPLVSVLLMLVAAVLSFFVNRNMDSELWRGIIQGVITFLASIGIVPPQAAARAAGTARVVPRA